MVPGDEILIKDVFGTIEYKGRGVFIAGGAGITPFIAILRQLKKDGKLEGNKLIFSNKTRKDIILGSEFKKMFKKNPDDLILTLDEETERKEGYFYETINEDFLKKHIKNFSQYFYICGPPKFVKDIKNTFAILGNVVGSIGLVVASITIFIVIFVNAITRRKFIGILKGIGISSRAIEIAYVFQSLFYAILGIGVGLLILYGFLVPFIAAHPIKFPFSDGILVAEYSATFLRVFLLSLATLIAGNVPARIVVKKNTLDSILGR